VIELEIDLTQGWPASHPQGWGALRATPNEGAMQPRAPLFFLICFILKNEINLNFFFILKKKLI
jgi:hypothetical protein